MQLENNLVVKRYTFEYHTNWNDFIQTSKNGTFLFHRDFMEYHADRFIDHSLLIFQEDKLLALFPANEQLSVIQSHGGLSYGGMILGFPIGASATLQIWEHICGYYKKNGFEEIIYKTIPKIYHRYPAEEDLYALFRTGAQLYRRDITFTIENIKRPKLSKGRKWLLARAKKCGVTVREQSDFSAFMELETENLKKRYQTKPVHTGEEMNLLHSSFPEQVNLFEAVGQHGQLLSGLVLFITDEVAHAQYIASSEEGKDIGAFDLIVDYALQRYQHLKYFDFGISTEQNGQYLNEGLAAYKESFGARGTVCDFYIQKL